MRVKEFGTYVMETDNPQKLKEFRALVLTKTSRYWEDFKDIKIAIGETLAQLSRRDDLIGWVRPSQEANMPALADEIARLSKENAELRVQIMQHTHSAPVYDPTETWKEFFDRVRKLALTSAQYWGQGTSERSLEEEKGFLYNTEHDGFGVERALAQLDFDVTGTSTESLLPQARQLDNALSKASAGLAEAQIDDFRRLVAKQLRSPGRAMSE